MTMRALLLMVALAMPALVFAQRDTAKAREAFLEGRAAMRERRTASAIDAFNRAVKLDDRSSEYFVWLGHAHTRDISSANFMRQGLIARRIRAAYDKAVELDSASIEAAESRHEYYMNAPGIAGGGMDRARAEAERLRKLDAQRGAIALGRIEEREKRLDAAEAFYKDAIDAYAVGKARPDSTTWAMAHFRAGIVREKRGDQSGAKAQYDRALELRPSYADALAAKRRVEKAPPASL
jgi:tetratricopeptide (TPR) repeat protein